MDMLSDCFATTDWSALREPNEDLNTFTDVVTSYIKFVEDVCVPSKSVKVYSNNKPWFSRDIKTLWRERDAAFKSSDSPL